MYSISNDEIRAMEKIGTGAFGNIYLKNNKVFKVYHKNIKAYNDILGLVNVVPNPCLNYNRLKYAYLKNKNIKLQRTDLIDDILYIDGIFSGVVMPYYDGETLQKHMNDSVESKVSMLRKILISAKELNDNYIYPLDYKEDNLILDGNNIKIIDLDDKLTKILNPIWKRKSIRILDEFIKRFIGDIDYNFYINMQREDIQQFLTKKEEIPNNTYENIERYLQKILSKKDYIFLYDNTNVINYTHILRNPNYRVVYIYDSMEKIEKKLTSLLKLNIQVYTIIPKKNLVDYISSIAYKELLTIKGDNITKVKKYIV